MMVASERRFREASRGWGIALVFGVSVVGTAAHADTVVMRNGKTYTGKIKSSEADVLVIRSEGIDWTLPLRDVVKQEQNDEGVEEAALIQPPPPPPAPPPPRDTGKKGKKGKNAKGKSRHVILYTEDKCRACVVLISTFIRNNDKLTFEERKITTASARAELCARASTFNLKCDKLPLLEYDGKLYDGANMLHAADGRFETLTY